MKFSTQLLRYLFMLCAIVIPGAAHAAWGLVDKLDLSPVVPLVFDAFMEVASGGYEFFVTGTDRMPGIIYLLVWLFFALTLALYSVKMFLPERWAQLLGFSGGGELFKDKPSDGFTILKNVFQPGMRTLIATLVLLQIKPVYVTEWLINPFLEFGSIYTHAITDGINSGGLIPVAEKKLACPEAILSRGWISENSCLFITQPISDISRVNNQMIKRGLDFVHQGLRGLITLIPHGGEDFMNLISGILLVVTFIGCNLFMALLIIQAIFGFGMSLILYPFYVLTWVAKPAKGSNDWFDIWPAFSGITKALQALIITMISCAFILTINIAVVRALFNWNSSVFVVAAGGSAASNVPNVTNNSLGFGGHSLTWLSAILTFYLMLKIFDLTRKRLNMYSPTKPDLYNQVTGDLRVVYKKSKAGLATLSRYAGLSEEPEKEGKKK